MTDGRTRIRTCAKVNLFLSVLGRRPDGYHEIETIFHGVRLADDMDFVANSTGEVTVDMDLIGVSGMAPPPHENLVWIAARRLIDRGVGPAGVHIVVRKRIPVGAGLGGGSSNAAGALVVLNELWDAGLDRAMLVEIAASIGSDVPYCISGGTVLAKSRGEQLTSLVSSASMWFVLAMSYKPLQTRDVYRSFDDVGTAGDANSLPMTLALAAGDVEEVASLLHNDLEPAAFRLRPELFERKELLLKAGALGASVAGSGSTLFGLCADEAHAESVAAAVAAHFDTVRVTTSAPECIERLA